MTLNVKGFGWALVVFALSTFAFAQESPLSAEEDASVALRNEALNLVYSSSIVVEDTRRGVDILTSLAEQGDVEAMIALGDLYLYGTLLPRDWDTALELYNTAADAGDGRGIYNYGMLLMWEGQDPALAEEMLVKAGELGVAEAWATLAEGAMYGYLGEGNVSLAKFDAFAERGIAEGIDRVVVLQATRYLKGIAVTENGSRALDVLEDAAEQGNTEALRFLIRLLRDGEGHTMAPDRLRALELLENYRPLLADTEFEQLRLTIIAASSSATSGFERLAQEIGERPDVLTVGFVRDLMEANANALTFLLQSNHAPTTQSQTPTGVGRAANDNPLFRGAAKDVDKSIVEYALDSPDYTTFVAAIQTAGLVDMLWSEGPFTVFAPTNAAFEALPESVFEELFLEKNRETLVSILTSHIVAGEISAAELASRARAYRDRFYHFKSISGAALSAQVRRTGRVFIFDENGDAYQIRQSDEALSNGIVHAVEGVLLPR